MSNQSAADKSEQATPEKIRKAKNDGNVGRSKEFTGAGALLACILYYHYAKDDIIEILNIMTQMVFVFDAESLSDKNAAINNTGMTLYLILKIFAPLAILLPISATLAATTVGGWYMGSKPIAFKPSNMSPIQGIKRIFSLDSFVELIKNILKVTLFFFVLYITIKASYLGIISQTRSSLTTSSSFLQSIFFEHVYTLIGLIFVFALIDYPYQIHKHKKKLKMSKQEVKDEHKQLEGSPEVKQKIKQAQQASAMNNASKTVPSADVIIMNPTHYAVAIKYDTNKARAPFVIAKGSDHVAFHIKHLAEANDVQILVSPQLARSIYYTTRVNMEIPDDLFIAVSNVLHYIRELKEWQRALQSGNQEKMPMPQMRPFSIPFYLQY
ncbi:flagellar biosynthesis protein FlhB [Vibrio breoganii]